jgi:hypothetical protein
VLILKPWRVRLTDPDDVARYGGRWWVYDEAAVMRLPVDELRAIEAQIYPIRLKGAIDDNRESGVMGELIALWVAMRMAADPEHPAPRFADFKPLIMLADWQRVPDEEVDPGTPLAEDLTSSPSTETAE